MPEITEQLPRWNMANVYPTINSPQFESDFEKVSKKLKELEEYFKKHGIDRLEKVPDDIKAVGAILTELIGIFNEVIEIFGTLEAYIYAFYTTDSYDTEVARKFSELEQVGILRRKITTKFEAWIGSLGPKLEEIYKLAPAVKEYKPILDYMAEQAKYLMETKMEDLATELEMSGGGVMWKLQGTITSQLKMPFERDGVIEELPMTVIRNLANNPVEDVRKRAYEAELKGWEKLRESVAFSLNGIKGSAITLAKWRGREDVLHESIDRDKMDWETLNALLAAMKDSFPMFRKYLKSKAKKLGKKKLPWWDLFAPVGKTELKYSWDEAAEFVVDQFNGFSKELGNFAKTAFDANWIDAGPRDGKRGGAYCMDIPKVEESRILTNFDGSFEGLSTLAHELGHGYHNFNQVGLPMLRRGSPMILAETASIFCETIVFNAALNIVPPETQVSILESQLIGATQVIVDIYSRFIFESEVIKRREKCELSADEFCEIMIDAQKQTYGDGLDENYLHKYMWLLKPHYYNTNFYNYPYAFGLLFGLGVYAMYKKEGESFIPRYKALLRSTGEGKAAELTGRFDIDIRSKDFWSSSLKIIEGQVDRYCEL